MSLLDDEDEEDGHDEGWPFCGGLDFSGESSAADRGFEEIVVSYFGAINAPPPPDPERKKKGGDT